MPTSKILQEGQILDLKDLGLEDVLKSEEKGSVFPAVYSASCYIDRIALSYADITVSYVYVDSNMETPPSSSGSEQYDVCSETVSFSKAEEWEKELMEDP